MEKDSFSQKVASLKLDEHTLQQIREQLQRRQVELDATEQELDDIFCKQEQLRLYVKLKAELEHKHQQLCDLNKQVASQAILNQQLERFDDFEKYRQTFQYIHVLERQLDALNLREQTLLEDKANNKATYDDLRQQWTTACYECDEAFRATTDAAFKMAQAAHHSERVNRANTELHTLEKILTEEGAYNDAIQQDFVNTESLLTEAQEEHKTVLEKLSALRPHQTMLDHSETVLTKLDNLFYLYQRRHALRHALEDSQQKQKQRNELLGELYVEHQQLTDEINTLTNEVAGHQQTIAGKASYTVQQNAITLHNRKQMLETALNIWTSIALGYNDMEEKTENIRVMKRKLEYQQQELSKLQADLHAQERALELKREQWLKTDFETQQHEVEAQRHNVRDIELELATIDGKLFTEQQNLALLQQQQQQQVANWQPFAKLDNALADCSEGTDRNTRVITLRTLIEQTTLGAEEAQRELDAYSFHINAINVTNERINEMRRRESELVVRLNEENTACQVLGQQVESARNRMDTVTREFSRLYEQLQTTITLQNWWQEWQVAPESIRLKIQQMALDWHDLKEQEHKLWQRIQLLTQHITDADALKQAHSRQLNFFKNMQQQLADESKEQQHLLDNITQEDEKVPFQLALEHYNECFAHLQHLTSNNTDAEEALLHIDVALTLLHQQREEIKSLLSKERMRVDVLMNQYNASHAPVSFDELKEFFSDKKDWNAIRKSLKELKTQQLIRQSEVDLLNTQIVALQIDGTNGEVGDGKEKLLSLLAQQQRLMNQRNNVLQSMAQLNNKLHQQELLNNLNS